MIGYIIGGGFGVAVLAVGAGKALLVWADRQQAKAEADARAAATPVEELALDDMQQRGEQADDLHAAGLDEVEAEFEAQARADAARRFGDSVTAYKQAAADAEPFKRLHIGVWPPVPTPPTAPRPPAAPRLANGTHGYGLRRAATVEQDLAVVDGLDLNPQRKQWLKTQIGAGVNLWDLLAENYDWPDLDPPAVGGVR